MTFNPSQARVPKGGPGGGRFGGAPRNASAAAAQKNVTAQKAGAKLTATPQAQRAAYLKTMSDGDLQALTALVYSHPSSDPQVVQMRMEVAAEMSKRGFDVKQFGAVGGGLPAKGKSSSKPPARITKVATAAKTARKVAPKAAPKAAAKPTPAQAAATARAGSQVHSATSVRAN